MKLTPENTLLHQVEFAECPPDEVKHPALVGGFGSGKTASIPLRWINLILWRGRNQSRSPRLMLVEPTNEMIRDILLEALNEFFDKWNIPHKYHKTYQNYSIYYKRNWHTAMLRSADKPNALTGKNLTDFLIDEFDKIPYNKQKEVWKECISRIRKAEYSTGAVVTTPEGFKMTYDLWQEKPIKGFKLYKAKTTDNYFLPSDYIENLYNQYDKKLISQYINAEFINIEADLVYYAFDRNKNVIPPYTDYQNVREVILSFDFNVNPMSAVEIITDIETGIRIQVMEYRVPNSKTADVCEQAIANIKEKYPSNISVIVTGDSSGDNRDTRSNRSDYEIIRDEFNSAGFSNDPGFAGRKYEMRVPDNKKPVRERVNMVNNLLDKGLYLICSNCIHSIKDREMVVWKKGAEQFKIDKSDSDRTHLSDAGDYGLQQSNYLVRTPTAPNHNPQDKRRGYS